MGRHRRQLGRPGRPRPAGRGRATARRPRRLGDRCSRLGREAVPRIAQRADAQRHRSGGKPGRRARAAARQPRVREEMNMLTRRSFIAASTAAYALVQSNIVFARANTERRFVFIIQRGAADGLSILAPTGDPVLPGLRGDFAQDSAGGAKLGSFFTLHPALAETAKIYADKQALFVHAVASPYRDRSHFDGQNVLETGGAVPYARKDGWLNRLVGLLPGGGEGIAITPTVPLALRGPARAGSHAPSTLQ